MAEEGSKPEDDLITREWFVQDIEYIGATTAGSMVTVDEDGLDQVKGKVPLSVRRTGILPDGYSVGEWAPQRPGR